MEYFLKIKALGQFPKLEIDETKFLELKSAKSILSNALDIEEKYEILISNYFELEKEVINLSVVNMVRGLTGYEDFFEIMLALNIRLVNLLSSARLYTDQIVSHTPKCLPNINNIKELTEKYLNEEYDNFFDYRFMEALRNYVQHRGIPVHKISPRKKWTESKEDFLEYSLYFSASKSRLIEDFKFKAAILKEMPDEIDLGLTTRGYIQSMSNVHDKIRQLIAENVIRARNTIESAISDYKIQHELTLCLSAFSAIQGDVIEDFSIFLDWDDIRIRLERKNEKLINLRKRYVSGKN